jgi:hypothetical protein
MFTNTTEEERKRIEREVSKPGRNSRPFCSLLSFHEPNVYFDLNCLVKSLFLIFLFKHARYYLIFLYDLTNLFHFVASLFPGIDKDSEKIKIYTFELK